MKNLISMTDFVVIESEKTTVHNVEIQFKLIYDYAKFLQQPLELWMFVPCDEYENVLEDPENTMKQGDGSVYYGSEPEDFEKYQQAKERCLFEGFSEKDAKIALFVNENIEDLTEFNLQLTQRVLTQRAIKQIGL